MVDSFYVNRTAHPITLSQNGLSIETIDGETGNITCTRTSIALLNGGKDIAFADAIPSAVSQLTNDAGYVTANAIPTNVSQLTNDAGYVTASEVSTSSLYPSSPYSAYVQIDDYGEVNAKKLLNQTDVWFVKAIMETSSTTPVTGYWVSYPKVTSNGTGITIEFWVQDKARQYEPQKYSFDAPNPSTSEVIMPVGYHSV